MKNYKKRIFTLLLSTVMVLESSASVFAKENNLKNVISDTKKVIEKNVPSPSVASIGGEWSVIGLARSENGINNTIKQKYLSNLKTTLANKKGVLSTTKNTEYSRVILALSALELSPSNIYSYNLLLPISDYNATVKQGVNGAIWALIALDSNDYKIPENKNVQNKATKQKYINYILSKQHWDGGFSLSENKKEKSDVDITAMALQALSKYQGDVRVSRATTTALNFLSFNQNGNGGYTYYGQENSESVSQVIIALSMLGIPMTDRRFVKNGNNLYDNLMSFNIKGKGFKHLKKQNEMNLMATEQAFIALNALERMENKKPDIYNMKKQTLKSKAA